MLRYLADENFHGFITRGLRLREPTLDLARVQDVNLSGSSDPEVLAWAADEGRILLTHDGATIPDAASQRIAQGQAMPGVFIVPRRMAVRRVIDELQLLANCSSAADWECVVLYLPL